MNIRIYQINFERDSKSAAFLGLDQMKHFFGNDEVNAEIYDKVFEGEVDCNSLDDVYAMFNVDHPEGYRGRSMSVSDVVEVVSAPEVVGEIHSGSKTQVFTDLMDYLSEQDALRDRNTDFEAHDMVGLNKQLVENGFYFCDSIGFKRVEFDPERTENKVPKNTIKVVLLEPGKLAHTAVIDSSLEGLQRTVGGYIQAVYPFEEEVCIVCNEEGKLMGLPPNRGLFADQEGREELVDLLCGTCFICDCSGENFGSLTDEQIKKYTVMFLKPERFYRMGNDIVAQPYEPKVSHIEER